jgi:hypothetical protein
MQSAVRTASSIRPPVVRQPLYGNVSVMDTWCNPLPCRVPASGVSLLGCGKRVGVALRLPGFPALHDEQEEMTEAAEEPPARDQGYDGCEQASGAARAQTQPGCDLRVGRQEPVDECVSGPEEDMLEHLEHFGGHKQAFGFHDLSGPLTNHNLLRHSHAKLTTSESPVAVSGGSGVIYEGTEAATFRTRKRLAL